MTKQNPFKQNKHEILYNLINSFLSGALVFIGALANGGVTKISFSVAVLTFLSVATLKFKEYWKTQKGEYSTKLFNFVGV